MTTSFSNIVYSDKFIQKNNPENDSDVSTKKYVDDNLELLKQRLGDNISPGSKLMDKILSKHRSAVLVNFDKDDQEVKIITADAQWPIKNNDEKYPLSHGGWMYINDKNTYKDQGINGYDASGNPKQTISYQKINWYFLNNSNKETIYKYGNMKCIFARIRLHDLSKENRPFINFYTHPFGPNAIPADKASWYRSSVVHSNNINDLTFRERTNNKDIVLYVGNHPVDSGFKDLHDVEEFVNCNYLSSPNGYRGPAGQSMPSNDEIVSLIALSTATDDGTGNVRFTLMEFGYRFGHQLVSKTTTYF
jgi:hypothetical protein